MIPNDTFGPLIDVLVPGDETVWPSASSALSSCETLFADLDEIDRDWLSELAAAVSALPPADRPRRVADAEAAAPDVFGRCLAALYRAYYTAPAVRAVVTAVAEAGPRELFPLIDAGLVARVVATRAGVRRL
jgi:hypothetical protein